MQAVEVYIQGEDGGGAAELMTLEAEQEPGGYYIRPACVQGAEAVRDYRAGTTAAS